MNKLHTENIPGNLHAASHWINRRGWGDYVLKMDRAGDYTIVVFRMPAELVYEIRRKSRSFREKPNFDDPE